MTSLFKSTTQAQYYAKFRPVYPSTLYAKIASSIRGTNKSMAIDVGCGTGQATVALTEHFDKVLGVDPSDEQLQHATPHPNVSYQAGQATQLPAQNGSVAVVTAAQAAHWFDIPKFYSEVDRVLQPGGCLALWTYGNFQLPNDNTLRHLVVEELYENTLGEKYWDRRRLLVENRYVDIPLLADERPDSYSGERITAGYDIEQEMTKEELLGYLRSWSGYTLYCQQNDIQEGSPQDPLTPIQEYLDSQRRYDANGIPVVFPVTILLSVKNGETTQQEE
ncbi:methylase [Nitzschia inconspicua]|uniref:Methylase n=1 Tax=Nitzschia inconspicua TaxID=303405 RepID=A0A9K3PQI2_9STRA|nr:methylase [Nitzschia inconspicua]